MRAARRAAVEAARGARRGGLVLGTLGRQGNPSVLAHMQAVLTKRGLEHVVVRRPGCASSVGGLFRSFMREAGRVKCACHSPLHGVVTARERAQAHCSKDNHKLPVLGTLCLVWSPEAACASYSRALGHSVLAGGMQRSAWL